MLRLILVFLLTLQVSGLFAQRGKIVVDGAKNMAQVSADLHGIFFEEISHGGEGGLYAEMIQNRGFEESKVPEGCTLDTGWISPPQTVHFGANRVVDWKMKWEPVNEHPAWSLEKENAEASISLDLADPLFKETPRSLKVAIKKMSETGSVTVVNDGFWGINVVGSEKYDLKFYARSKNYKGEVIAQLVGANGKILASERFSISKKGWTKYTAGLTANSSDPKAKLKLKFTHPGTVWLDFVSLFPRKTFKGRPNGMRYDLAQYLADLKPAFVRWPGGCFVEGISVESAPNWRRSLGPIEQRSGTYSPWGYWSSDGIGYHEFLQFCEDIDADAMYVFNAGIACEMRSGVHVGEDQVPAIIADVLDAIEYAIGPETSKWGSARAKNGHPKPFSLKYVEVGNEQVGEKYAARFNKFYDAIKQKYPQLEILAAMGIAHLSNPTIKAIRKMDFADEHAYKAAGWAMAYHDWYDKYKREDWKLYVGEYACNGGVGSGNMNAALNDATFILGMERNSDLVRMSSYAPLLENINDTDWPVNLIRFDNARSFARISYYAIRMLNGNKATVNLMTSVEAPEPEDVASFQGGIALSTWDTQAEFRNIQVMKDGKILYESNAIRNDEWNFEGGHWTTTGETIAQTQDGAWPMAALKDRTFDTYTLRLQARKTGGPNAFMIPFAIKDQKNYMRAHIGAWWNSVSAFEMVTNGADAMVSQPVRLESPINLNEWYDVELRVGTNTVECYLNSKLLMSYKKPGSVFAIAGKDEQSNEIILKVVNASGKPRPIDLKFLNVNFKDTATLIELNSNSQNDENSFEHPEQFVPKQSQLQLHDDTLDQFEFKPWSLTVIRLRVK